MQRSSKFVKYLGQYGFEPVVVTKKYEGNLIDESLMQDIPKGLKIFRLNPYDMIHGSGVIGFIKKAIGIKILSPDAEYFWNKFNQKKVLEIARKEAVDVIYTTSFPYSSHLLGFYLKKNLPHIPWVCDFRDEWTNNPYHLDDFFKRMKFKFEKGMELDITKNCDFLITNSAFMLENFIKDMPSLDGRSDYIPNGYDESDFEEVVDKRDGGDKFVITHTGSLYGRRNLDEFLEGLKLSIDEGKIDKNKVEIRLVGNLKETMVASYAEKYDLKDQIKMLGYMAHKESIQMLFNSDILLLIIGTGEGSKNFYSGKIFEYIRANRQILTIGPTDGAAAEVINQTNTGTVFECDDIRGISNALNSYYEEFLNGGVRHNPNVDELRAYSRTSQSEKLAKIFDLAISKLKEEKIKTA